MDYEVTFEDAAQATVRVSASSPEEARAAFMALDKAELRRAWLGQAGAPDFKIARVAPAGMGAGYDIDALAREFAGAYDALYAARDDATGLGWDYRRAVAEGDALVSSGHRLVEEFCAARRDFIGSDRECAALAIAAHSMGYL